MAFSLNDSGDMYFQVTDIIKFRAGDYIATIKVLKMDAVTKDLIVTNLLVKTLDAIKSLTVRDFYERAMQNLNELRLSYEITKNKEIKAIIKKYEHHSFKARRR